MPDLTPGLGQVVVRVAAVACNFPDILICQGKYQERPPLPFTPGMEIVGEVVAVGDGADAGVGDRVIAKAGTRGGGFAELAVVGASSLWRWPEGMTAALVGAELALTEAPEALHRFATRATVGKIVLVP